MFFTDIIKKEIEQPNIEDMNLFDSIIKHLKR